MSTTAGRIAASLHEAYERHIKPWRKSHIAWDELPQVAREQRTAAVESLLSAGQIQSLQPRDHLESLMNMARVTMDSKFPDEGGVTVALHVGTDGSSSFVVTGDKNHWEGDDLLVLIEEAK